MLADTYSSRATSRGLEANGGQKHGASVPDTLRRLHIRALAATEWALDCGFLHVVDCLSTLTDTPIWLASGMIVVIMSVMEPSGLRSLREWRHFLWLLPVTNVALAVVGYAILSWLFGNELAPVVKIVGWSVLAACTLIGPLIAWCRGRSFAWPEAGEQ